MQLGRALGLVDGGTGTVHAGQDYAGCLGNDHRERMVGVHDGQSEGRGRRVGTRGAGVRVWHATVHVEQGNPLCPMRAQARA
jgi:hypothetical protein